VVHPPEMVSCIDNTAVTEQHIACHMLPLLATHVQAYCRPHVCVLEYT
jgi:hypothetical protein